MVTKVSCVSPGVPSHVSQTLLSATEPSPEDVALIAELHGLPSADLAPPLDLTPQRRKEKTFEALLRQVEGLVRQRPVLLVFDDLHWIDPSSRELLDRLIERVAAWPVLLLGLFRPEFQPPWVGQPHVTLLTLTRLDRHDTGTMVANVAGGAALSPEIVAEIAERTDGVPLFIEELTKAVLEAGAQGTAALSAIPHPALSVPPTLHASLMARLDRLGAAAREVAQAGAAIGREFDYVLLVAISDLPEQQSWEALDRLTAAGLVFARGTPPEANYLFKHALVQDAAYGSMLRGRRQSLHRRIAATLEEQFPEVVQAQPALLAQHCQDAGLAEKAVGYWLKAGQQALARSAMAEAEAQLHKGLKILATLPDSSWRRQQELDLQVTLTWAMSGAKGISAPEVGETLARARKLAEDVDQPEHIVSLMGGQWHFHLGRSEHKLALTLGEQMEKIGEARNDVELQLVGCGWQAVSHCSLGEFVAARASVERCRGLPDWAHRVHPATMFEDPYALLLVQHAMTLAYLGYIDEARSRLAEALLEARRLEQPGTMIVVLLLSNWTESIICSPDLQRTGEIMALSTEHSFPGMLAWALTQRGRSLAILGQAQEGLMLLTQGLDALRAAECVLHTPTALAWQAEVHAMLGQPGEGLNCLAEAAQIIETTDERYHEAELQRLRGDLLGMIGDLSVAERSYDHAIAVARSQSAKLLELRASASLARLWHDQGKYAEARNLLGPIYGWFTEGFDAPDLKEAKALLDELA